MRRGRRRRSEEGRGLGGEGILEGGRDGAWKGRRGVCDDRLEWGA